MRYSLIDTHCHITCDVLFEKIDKIIENATQQHVDRMLVVCTNFKEYARAEKLKETYPSMFDIALGVHPNDVYNFTEMDYEHVEHLLMQGKLQALGEIGLDYHWGDVKKEDQKMSFIRQIELAKKYNKPIVIHMRDASKDMVEILQQYAPIMGVMHCYSGSYETARSLLKIGLYFSFAGPLTFKNSRGLPEIASQLPLDRIFVETDCPYLTPHPFRGKLNEPKYVVYTFEKLCEIKELTREEVANQMQTNYELLFHDYKKRGCNEIDTSENSND